MTHIVLDLIYYLESRLQMGRLELMQHSNLGFLGHVACVEEGINIAKLHSPILLKPPNKAQVKFYG